MGSNLSLIGVITLGIAHIVSADVGTCQAEISDAWEAKCNAIRSEAKCNSHPSEDNTQCDWTSALCRKKASSADTVTVCDYISQAVCTDTAHSAACEWIVNHPVSLRDPVDEKQAGVYLRTMAYGQLDCPYTGAQAINPQTPQRGVNPLVMYKMPLFRWQRYLKHGFPTGERTNVRVEKFPDGVYSFVVTKKDPSEMKMVWGPFRAPLPHYGHTSLLTNVQYQQWLRGKFHILYAGELVVQNGVITHWSAKSGHLMADQNKYRVFAKHWKLPKSKFVDFKKRFASKVWWGDTLEDDYDDVAFENLMAQKEALEDKRVREKKKIERLKHEHRLIEANRDGSRRY